MTIRKTYAPVVRGTSRDKLLTGAVLTGVNSATIGWSYDKTADRKDLLGFAVRRTDYDSETKEVLRVDWLNGQKRFKGIHGDAGGDIRSDQAPFQRFRWGDYSLDPSKSYQYEIFPMRGKPGSLERGEPLTMNIRPSDAVVDGVGVYFNRGVTSALAYMRRFGGLHPEEVLDGEAWRWLSRGLKESVLDFIDQTKKNEQLHLAIYEFFDLEIAEHLRAAKNRGVKLHIVYHAKKGDKATKESEAVLHAVGLDRASTATARTQTSAISHNKFLVRLTMSGRPKAVLTGSANFSENAFHFQTNCALVFEHAGLASLYEEYFQLLKQNLSAKRGSDPNMKEEVAAFVEAFSKALPKSMQKVMFSPVSSKHVVETARELLAQAQSCVLVSSPFGLATKDFEDALEENPGTILEYGLANSSATKKIESYNHHNTRFFPPATLKRYMGETWDSKAFGNHKIHTKSLVVDPWGDNPAILIGSANFSGPSCTSNDENCLLIRGDKRLAAIVTTEFMRMYEHYRNRFWIKKIAEERKRTGEPPDDSSWFLSNTSAWSKTAYSPKSFSHKFRDREVFSGQQ